MAISQIEVSIVSPVFNAAETIPELVSRLSLEACKISQNFEIILVDDGSEDDCWKTIQFLKNKNSKIRALKLSKNYGQHLAILAGLQNASGKYTFVLDCDLQHPPEALRKLYHQARRGFDIVLARHPDRKHAFLRNIGANLFLLAKKILTGKATPPLNVGTFSCLSRKTVNAFMEFKDIHLHYLQNLYGLGFPISYVEIAHNKRFKGRSGYTVIKLLNHFLDGLIINPRRLLLGLMCAGFFVFACCFAGVIFAVYNWITVGVFPGWTSLSIILMALSGLNSLVLSFLGIYISAIFEQTKNKPLFLIEKTINL